MKLKNRVQKMVMTGVCAALLVVFSQIAIPMPTGVPITLQTFAVALCGYVLGARLGVAAAAVYLALGAAGLPVLAEFSGGIGFFLGMTGGYLWGFLFFALFCGLGASRSNPVWAVTLGLLGLILCHVCGMAQFAAVTATPVWEAFLVASLPYLLKDAVSTALAFGISKGLLVCLQKAGAAGRA